LSNYPGVSLRKGPGGRHPGGREKAEVFSDNVPGRFFYLLIGELLPGFVEQPLPMNRGTNSSMNNSLKLQNEISGLPVCSIKFLN